MGSYYCVDSMTDDGLLDIADDLPHGSGIDCDWFGYVTKDNVCFTNAYHAMDSNGYYDGYADFTIKLPLVDSCVQWDNFTLHFNGRTSAYLNQKHYLREYLEDTLYYGLSQIFNR
jgi:hypothetical protein